MGRSPSGWLHRRSPYQIRWPRSPCDVLHFSVRISTSDEAPAMSRILRSFAFRTVVILACLASAFAQYQKAPQPIHDLLNAPPTPLVLVSPGSDQLLVADRLQYPPIAGLAQPMLRLAGLRINPATNGRHHPPRLVSLSLVDVATGKTRKVTGLPVNAYLSVPIWSPDGKQFAFTNTTANGIELWLGNAATSSAVREEGVGISAVMGEPVQWMPDSHTLLVQTVPGNRGKAPEE